jgi:hypothetical protein
MKTQIRKGEKSGGLPELLSESDDKIRAGLIATRSAFEAAAI